MRIKLLSENLSATLLLTAVLSILLSACSSDGEERPEYLGANSVQALEIPPKLSIPDTQGALRLPEPSRNAKAGEGKFTESKVIAPEFSGFELKNDSRLYWLEINMPVNEVWAMLPGFLASEGIQVERIEKLLGFVDTAWMSEYQISYNVEGSSSWFSGFSPDYKDRFRIRVEAGESDNTTRLYVSHRGLQISVATDITEWVQRDSEPFLEREIMYRFVLFGGVGKTGATELLASYNSYQPRVNKVNDKVGEIDVKGEADTIWLRMQIAMDRLGVDVLKSDKVSRIMSVRVGNMKLEKKPAEDESGWFSGLFSGKDVDVDEDEGYETPEYKIQPAIVAPEDQITLQLTQIVSESFSKIKIQHEDGSDIKGGLARLFRDALLKQLK